MGAVSKREWQESIRYIMDSGCRFFGRGVKNEKMYDVSDGDMGMYLLGVFRFWNIYEYYSPNVEITTEDWDIFLRNAIPSVAGAGNYHSYAKAIAEVVAKTGDAHSLVVDEE